MTHRIQAFLSYSTKYWEDFEGVHDALCKGLCARVEEDFPNGFAFWRDKERLRAGERWGEQLAEAVGTCDILVILLSGHWLQSSFCRQEYVEFKRRQGERAPVVPILLHDIRPDLQDQLYKELVGSDGTLARTGRQALRIPREDLARALDPRSGDKGVEDVFAAPVRQLKSLIQVLQAAPPSCPVPAAVRLTSTRLGSLDLEVASVPPGPGMVRLAGRQQPITFKRGFRITTRPITLAEFERAFDRPPRATASCLDVDAAFDAARRAHWNVSLPSESEWEHTMLAGRSEAMRDAGGRNPWGVFLPDPRQPELVADQFEQQVRRACPDDGGVARAVTGMQVVLTLRDGRIERSSKPVHDITGAPIFRVVFRD